MDYSDGKTCPYCNKPTEYVDSSQIYGKSYGMIYLCSPCQAYVGCHKSEPTKAKGRLANAELRSAKIEAHKYFDMIWEQKHLSRSEAYSWLSEQISIEPNYCHIGMFDVKECKEVVDLSKMLLNDLRRIDLDFGVEPINPYFERA